MSSSFPNLTEYEKDRLLELFLTDSTLYVADEQEYKLIVMPENKPVKLVKEDGELLYRVMKDKYRVRFLVKFKGFSDTAETLFGRKEL